MNVIVVDWSYYAKWSYLKAKNGNLLYGAHVVTALIQDLMRLYEIPVSAVRDFLLGILIIGHSLGAHMSGWIGRLIQEITHRKIGTIVGLDPAGPLMSPLYAEEDGLHFLSYVDATKVMVLHTSSLFFGTAYAAAHEDYFINGGRLVVLSSPILSHMRVVNFIRAIIINTGLAIGYLCTLLTEYTQSTNPPISGMTKVGFDMFTVPHGAVVRRVIPLYMHVEDKYPFIGTAPEIIPSHTEAYHTFQTITSRPSHSSSRRSPSSSKQTGSKKDDLVAKVTFGKLGDLVRSSSAVRASSSKAESVNQAAQSAHPSPSHRYAAGVANPKTVPVRKMSTKPIGFPLGRATSHGV